ncbi:MAG: hypothetical protein IH957_13410 [Chloroflexi bacterium]|nr:hypothetical protein [Chloroflexota bacterium]
MYVLGWVWERLKVPPMVERVDLDAETCGVNLSIRTSPRYTILTIDGRELFFELLDFFPKDIAGTIDHVGYSLKHVFFDGARLRLQINQRDRGCC